MASGKSDLRPERIQQSRQAFNQFQTAHHCQSCGHFMLGKRTGLDRRGQNDGLNADCGTVLESYPVIAENIRANLH